MEDAACATRRRRRILQNRILSCNKYLTVFPAVFDWEISSDRKEEKSMNAETTTQKRTRADSIGRTRYLVQIGMLAGIAVVLMLFDIPLPFAPSFYQIDLSELPVLIGAFAMGPMAGVLIELIKVLLNLVINGTDTAFVGEFANFLIGCALIVPAALVYQRKKTRKSAVIGMTLGTIVMAAVGGVINAYVLLPAYSAAFGIPIDGLVEMGAAVNRAITSLPTFCLFAVVPFNLVKGLVVSVITLLLYKHISRILKGEAMQ